MHYYVGSITLNSHLNTYHSPRAGATTTQINTLITAWGYNTSEFLDHFYNLHDNLVMEIGYENLMGIISSKITNQLLPKPLKIGNDYYLNNNATNKHDIQNGLIHTKLREDAIPYIELL